MRRGDADLTLSIKMQTESSSSSVAGTAEDACLQAAANIRRMVRPNLVEPRFKQLGVALKVGGGREQQQPRNPGSEPKFNPGGNPGFKPRFNPGSNPG